MKRWRCGHERTPENTHGPYPSHTGQCAECWREARRRSEARHDLPSTVGPYMNRMLRKAQRDTANYQRRRLESADERRAAASAGAA